MDKKIFYTIIIVIITITNIILYSNVLYSKGNYRKKINNEKQVQNIIV